MKNISIYKKYKKRKTRNYISIKSKNKSIIYEFYPSDIKHNNVICTRFDFLEKPNSDSELSWLQKRLVDYISEATGFERVIYYQFMHNGDGEVIHESVSSSHIGSYIGLRFPASDIPRIARDLYVLNPWRYIYNAPDITTPVVGITPSAPDLTYASFMYRTLSGKRINNTV